ncbi:MAG: hypothetical protein WCT47_01760 [Betaproteobacteria bacterium]|jgi:hypothetical protein
MIDLNSEYQVMQYPDDSLIAGATEARPNRTRFVRQGTALV